MYIYIYKCVCKYIHIYIYIYIYPCNKLKRNLHPRALHDTERALNETERALKYTNGASSPCSGRPRLTAFPSSVIQGPSCFLQVPASRPAQFVSCRGLAGTE